MPAWGVRTALTALRSFMAEKGSAGQVGGMEAKPEVRQRLARESRGWRCEGCGGRTNSEIMQEWWEICKESGVQVEEEMSLEALPEGLSLETGEPGSKAENSQPRPETEREPAQDVSSASPREEAGASKLPCPVNQVLPASASVALATSSGRHSQSDDQTKAEYPPVSNTIPAPNTTPPNASATSSTYHQPHAQPASQQDTSEQPSPLSSPRLHTSIRPPTSATTAPTPRNPNAAPHNATAPNNAEDFATGTIDKAIGAIFVALLIMILKKIFYPAGEGGGSMEGLYMSGD